MLNSIILYQCFNCKTRSISDGKNSPEMAGEKLEHYGKFVFFFEDRDTKQTKDELFVYDLNIFFFFDKVLGWSIKYNNHFFFALHIDWRSIFTQFEQLKQKLVNLLLH